MHKAGEANGIFCIETRAIIAKAMIKSIIVLRQVSHSLRL